MSQSDAKSIRLLCFPYAGGHTHIFKGWPELVDSGIEIVPVCLPGRGQRAAERAFTDIRPLVHSLATELEGYTEKPYALFGHSLGGLISFELAREFRRRELPSAQHLFVSAVEPPALISRTEKTYELDDAALVRKLQNYGGTPDEVFESQELLDYFLPIVRADFAVVEDYCYNPETPLESPISVFAGTSDPYVRTEVLKNWQDYSIKDVTIHQVNGEHFFLNEFESEIVTKICSNLKCIGANTSIVLDGLD